MKFYFLDDEGNYIKDVNIDSHPTIIIDDEEVLSPNYTSVECPQGYSAPKFVDGAWIDADESLTLQKSIESKVSEMSALCANKVESGIDFTYEGTTKHYSLKQEDQIMLNTLYTAVSNGATQVAWHNNDGDCEVFSAEKFIQFFTQGMTLVVETTTRFNTGIRPYLRTLTDKESVETFEWDNPLTEDLEAKVAEMITVNLSAFGISYA